MPKQNDAVQLTPAEEREAFSSTFAGVVPDNIRALDDNGRAMETRIQNGKGTMSERHLKYLTRLMGAERRIIAQGFTSATILNSNPYQLKVNSTLIGDIVCAPCPKGRPYSITVIDNIRWTREEGTEGDDMPTPWVPIILAREFEETYFLNGGVVIYSGNGLKEDPNIAMQRDKSLLRNFEAAEARKLGWMREKIREANNEWNTPNRQGARNINDIHRACAATLHDVTGQELPAWMDKVPGQMGLGEKCPSCSAIPPSEAVICPGCSFVLQPRKAFDLGIIEVENIALARLGRSELETMGISELVEETVEERKARYLEQAKEKSKAAKKSAKTNQD
jgi:hypothetical protein